MNKGTLELKLLFEAHRPKGLTATDIARIDPKWLQAPLDELCDLGEIKGKYEKIDGVWICVYRLVNCVETVKEGKQV